MRLITLSDVGFTWQKPSLLDNLELAIDSGERIGLLGRNGTGKSTLMKLLSGDLTPDHGEIRRMPKIKVARLIQEIPQQTMGTIQEVVAAGLPSHDPSVDEYDEEHWQREAALHRTLSRMNLDGEATVADLSAGMKRRVLLAQAIVQEPDLLLLDEPTNHLDIESILWLEEFLKSFEGSLLFVTHDRIFLKSLATRVLEIDRGRLFDWECDYETFLKRKADVLAAEEKQEALFDKRLAAEEVWIRQGIKARRTRNEGRVRALEAMRRDSAGRRQRMGNAKLQATAADRSGQLVLELKNVSFAYQERPIIDDFSTLITRGDRIGVVGPNGAGKSTLLKLLLGQLQPTSGSIRQGTKLEVLYFDQLREQIDDEKTIAQNVSPDEDKLMINGVQRHIFSYLQDFLFTPERSRQLAKFLSGGERNRLLLARLFKNSSNVLVLDEPTNDLDAETLELLEELVSNYAGTLLLVSHDRAFLNNVVTSIIAVDGSGQVKEYGGGYDDYQRARQADSKPVPAILSPARDSLRGAKEDASKKSVGSKLSFKELRELETLPKKIESLEIQQAQVHQEMANPEFYKQPQEKIIETTAQLSKIKNELAIVFERWESLESRSAN
ncbi:MAG: ATP-binding cassette domain-containing protein [Pirellulaceae bacterium]|nr:ATP-binding cassette domain-containing protein [Pirellulaceae bacterium]